MCTNCNYNVPYTVQDLKIDFLNEVGYRAENEIGMYINWLEERLVNQRNYEHHAEQANIETTTDLMNRKKAAGEVC
jgi:hypothetical protein